MFLHTFQNIAQFKKHNLARFDGRVEQDKANYKAFRRVETLFVQGRNLVPSRPAIGWRRLFTFHQPLRPHDT